MSVIIRGYAITIEQLAAVPEEEGGATLEFNPAKIRAAIDAGRRAVGREWDALAPSLTRD